MMTETNEAKETMQPEAPNKDQMNNKEKYDIDFVLDIPLEVSVELGRVTMLVNDLLQLGPGSIIELSKLVGEPLQIYINNQMIAKGEVVVLDEKFGIRVTEITSPKERVKSLG
jgi:flagellar motor switch protein FliN/FliY